MREVINETAYDGAYWRANERGCCTGQCISETALMRKEGQARYLLPVKIIMGACSS